MKTDILLIVDTVDNAITRAGIELAGLAGQLSAVTGADKAAFLVTGADIRKPAEDLAGQSGLDVYLVEHPALRYPNPELLADLVQHMAAASGCRFICFLHTSAGCHAAAGTAVNIEAPCLAGVDRIMDDPQGLVLRSALFNGRMNMEVRPDQELLVMTVLPGAFRFSSDGQENKSCGRVKAGPVAEDKATYRPLGIARAIEADAAIDRADILVAVGRGIGEVENLALVEELVSLLPNAAMAASRPLCDLKWLPYSRQVGATGRTVSPRLYLACGISGAQQHVYGMKESQWIVAINTDPRAAIFDIADHCIIEDLSTFLPLLIEACREIDA